MRIVPVFKCTDMKTALFFYTKILDFKIKYKDASENDPVVFLKNGGAEIMLSTMVGEKPFRSAANVYVRDVDALFKKYLDRGLDISGKEDSPVHQGPLNQTWGTREFYVSDPDDNTLCFVNEQ